MKGFYYFEAQSHCRKQVLTASFAISERFADNRFKTWDYISSIPTIRERDLTSIQNAEVSIVLLSSLVSLTYSSANCVADLSASVFISRVTQTLLQFIAPVGLLQQSTTIRTHPVVNLQTKISPFLQTISRYVFSIPLENPLCIGHILIRVIKILLVYSGNMAQCLQTSSLISSTTFFNE